MLGHGKLLGNRSNDIWKMSRCALTGAARERRIDGNSP
ncbi:putative omega-amino acid--pyruvate aminotransferase [Burkholderia thailandensis]|uniref:Omega-amino acid--pyruvate aminotransferase n=1 Tax=Burkholderia thailandensis TaxID=57975 RepID=A0AAW9CUP7_BURTH|nr:putative omega-amino acid--pyruvate aminotransferase [Burkholderia thailandensis]MDW9254370.1 putative omega-amino acid--pyruvate aminotransferase [Burkholderia thailandensis]